MPIEQNEYQPLEHKVFTELFNTLFENKHTGLCFGLGQMAKKAMLLGEADIEKFNNRLSLIENTTLQLGTYNKEQFLTQLQITTAEKTLLQYWNVVAFLTQVELIHCSDKYPVLFPNAKVGVQDINKINTLLKSNLPDETQGELIDSFTNNYTLKNIESYFNKLYSQLKTQKNNSPAFVMTLESANHLITIGYSFQKKSWMIFDANNMPIVYQPTTTALAKVVFDGFNSHNSKTPYCGISTCIYSLTENKRNTIPLVTAWKKSLSTLHSGVNAQGVSLLWLTVAGNDTTNLPGLLKSEKKERKNINTSYEHFTALNLAAQHGEHKVASLLIEHGADINSKKSPNTPVYIASQYGHTGCVELLLNNKKANIKEVGHIDFHEKYSNDFLPTVSKKRFAQLPPSYKTSKKMPITPLLVAYLNGHDDVVDLLCDHALKHGKPIDTRGNTPLHFSIWLKDLPLTLKLLKQGADLKAKNILKQSPFDFCNKDSPCQALLNLYRYKQNKEKLLHKKLGIFTPINKRKAQEQRDIASHIIACVEKKNPVPATIIKKLETESHLAKLNCFYKKISPVIEYQKKDEVKNHTM